MVFQKQSLPDDLGIVTADDVDKDDKINSPQPESPVTDLDFNDLQTSIAKPPSAAQTVPLDQPPFKPPLEVDGRMIPDAEVMTEFVEGILAIMPEGHGFLRPNFLPSPRDIYISGTQIRRFRLREGDKVGGQARAPKDSERYFGLLKVEKINGEEAENLPSRPWFDQLTPIFPQPQIVLETKPDVLSTRLIDLICPIGRGQRGLIVSPPKAGKTWLLKDIVAAVSANYPDLHVIAILIGERPEEVTDISRYVKGETIASNFDDPPLHQAKVAEIALERAKRLVEMGKHVFIILDSVTRLARAYNLSVPTTGRSLSGGFDPGALYPAKQFFGAARNIENGGSLTIIGTALIDTDSRMDNLIYEEFKGTGNMELHLDRTLADRRIFPAFDIQRSGTRKEELLFGDDYKAVMVMRRMTDLLDKEERTEAFIRELAKTKTNKEFLKMLGKKAK